MATGYEGLMVAGDLRFAKIVGGVQQGYGDVINAVQLSFSKEGGEQYQKLSRKRDNYNSVEGSVSVGGYDVLTVSTDDLAKAEVIAAYLMGTVAEVSAVAGSLTAASVVAQHDLWVSVGQRDLDSATIVVQDETDVTTYVAGTDYEVDAKAGLIKALSTGSITDAETLHFTADYAAKSGYEISTETTSVEYRVAVLMDGINLANQKQVTVEVTDVPLTPSGEADLAGPGLDKQVSWSGAISGTVKINYLD